MRPIFKTKMLIYQSKVNLDCVHTMPAHFENDENIEHSLQNVLVRVPFSNSTVFKICRQKMCRFRVNGRPIR